MINGQILSLAATRPPVWVSGLIYLRGGESVLQAVEALTAQRAVLLPDEGGGGGGWGKQKKKHQKTQQKLCLSLFQRGAMHHRADRCYYSGEQGVAASNVIAGLQKVVCHREKFHPRNNLVS